MALSWTLTASSEEIVYHGYFRKLLSDLFGSNGPGILMAVGIPSLLFGLSHNKRGIIGVLVTTVDAIIFSWPKRKFGNNLWAAILSHGLHNSIGVIVFYFVGPITGF